MRCNVRQLMKMTYDPWSSSLAETAWIKHSLYKDTRKIMAAQRVLDQDMLLIIQFEAD